MCVIPNHRQRGTSGGGTTTLVRVEELGWDARSDQESRELWKAVENFCAISRREWSQPARGVADTSKPGAWCRCFILEVRGSGRADYSQQLYGSGATGEERLSYGMAMLYTKDKCCLQEYNNTLTILCANGILNPSVGMRLELMLMKLILEWSPLGLPSYVRSRAKLIAFHRNGRERKAKLENKARQPFTISDLSSVEEFAVVIYATFLLRPDVRLPKEHCAGLRRQNHIPSTTVCWWAVPESSRPEPERYCQIQATGSRASSTVPLLQKLLNQPAQVTKTLCHFIIPKHGFCS